MPPRRRRLLPALAVAGVAVALGAWVWRAFAAPADEDDVVVSGSVNGHHAGNKRKKPGLTLIASTLPPTPAIDLLSRHFDLTLVLPASLPLPVDAEELYPVPSFDARRVLKAETSEGRVHIARALGGSVVLFLGDDEDDEAELLKGLGTWARGIWVVGTAAVTAEVRPGVTNVEDWASLAMALRVS